MNENPNQPDDFYVGYRPVSRAQRRFNIAAIAIFVAGAFTFAAALAVNQSDPGDGVWETSEQTEYEGRLVLDPAPMLITTDNTGRPRTVLLVDYNKFGADSRIAPHVGRRAVVRGARIHRFDINMLELDPEGDGVEPLESDAAPTAEIAWSDAEPITIRGEIIDPKCYLGAMKPGRGKTHKACAIRCISGGIPPMLLAAHPDGRPRLFLLRASGDVALRDLVLPHIADPVEIRGVRRIAPDAPFETLDIGPGDITPL